MALIDNSRTSIQRWRTSVSSSSFARVHRERHYSAEGFT